MNQYEAMFLFDPTFGASFENCEAEIRRIMERANAEVVFCKRWDERRLSYKIRGRKRGLYVLTYFKGPSDKISGLERDCQISENILRVLVLRAEGVTPEMMEKAIATRGADTTADAAAGKRGADGAVIPGTDLDFIGGFGESDRRGDRGRRGGGGGGRRPAVAEAFDD